MSVYIIFAFIMPMMQCSEIDYSFSVLTLNVYIKENNWWPLLYFNKIVSNGQ